MKNIPTTGHGSIVITSRNAYPGRDALSTSGLQATTFGVEQGAEFFLHFLTGLAPPTEEDRDAAKVISQRYDGVPPAIRQAAYIV
ncbi:hypothetical protein GJ744_009137 [Endocarpon pusillum]|uniref:Uncharacterized protein n=1 Tax=Endocarpon pusillum TaxID=364733 RepID=A0A8H7E565_9EURO|nr:hypothetical protein GJ744_009137 [Endocarpon pusillum]